jgi:hypothetical protein
MKRLQKSFTSAAPNNTRSGGGHSKPPQSSFDNSDSTLDHEKENNIPSSAGAASTNATTNDTELPIFDSTIVSIAERAVAVNFPSSYIRPVPIKREDIHGSLPRTDEQSSELPARTPVDATKTPTPIPAHHDRASGEIFQNRTILTAPDSIAGIEFIQRTNETKKNLVLGEMAVETNYGIRGDVYIEIDRAEDGEMDEEHSPLLVTASATR